MTPFTTLDAVAVPVGMDDVDTDLIIPARFMRKSRGDGLQRYFFHDQRFANDGSELPDFVLNCPAYSGAGILVAGRNFGCGSSREAAVYALVDFGIRAVVAASFGDIFRGNLLQNGVLPLILPDEICSDLRHQLEGSPGARIAIDLQEQTLRGPDGLVHRFDIDASVKERLLKGLDDIELILQQRAEIERFEARYAEQRPWR